MSWVLQTDTDRGWPIICLKWLPWDVSNNFMMNLYTRQDMLLILTTINKSSSILTIPITSFHLMQILSWRVTITRKGEEIIQTKTLVYAILKLWSCYTQLAIWDCETLQTKSSKQQLLSCCISGVAVYLISCIACCIRNKVLKFVGGEPEFSQEDPTPYQMELASKEQRLGSHHPEVIIASSTWKLMYLSIIQA